MFQNGISQNTNVLEGTVFAEKVTYIEGYTIVIVINCHDADVTRVLKKAKRSFTKNCYTKL